MFRPRLGSSAVGTRGHGMRGDDPERRARQREPRKRSRAATPESLSYRQEVRDIHRPAEHPGAEEATRFHRIQFDTKMAVDEDPAFRARPLTPRDPIRGGFTVACFHNSARRVLLGRAVAAPGRLGGRETETARARRISGHHCFSR